MKNFNVTKRCLQQSKHGVLFVMFSMLLAVPADVLGAGTTSIKNLSRNDVVSAFNINVRQHVVCLLKEMKEEKVNSTNKSQFKDLLQECKISGDFENADYPTICMLPNATEWLFDFVSSAESPKNPLRTQLQHKLREEAQFLAEKLSSALNQQCPSKNREMFKEILQKKDLFLSAPTPPHTHCQEHPFVEFLKGKNISLDPFIETAILVANPNKPQCKYSCGSFIPSDILENYLAGTPYNFKFVPNDTQAAILDLFNNLVKKHPLDIKPLFNNDSYNQSTDNSQRIYLDGLLESAFWTQLNLRQRYHIRGTAGWNVLEKTSIYGATTVAVIATLTTLLASAKVAYDAIKLCRTPGTNVVSCLKQAFINNKNALINFVTRKNIDTKIVSQPQKTTALLQKNNFSSAKNTPKTLAKRKY